MGCIIFSSNGISVADSTASITDPTTAAATATQRNVLSRIPIRFIYWLIWSKTKSQQEGTIYQNRSFTQSFLQMIYHLIDSKIIHISGFYRLTLQFIQGSTLSIKLSKHFLLSYSKSSDV